MEIVDFIILFISLVYSILGLINGFAKQLISILGWLLLIFILFNYLDYITYNISSFIDLGEYNRILTITILIILTLIFIFIVNLFLSKIIASVLFGSFDRLLGMIFSLAKAQIYIFIFTLIIIDTPLKDDVITQSVLLPYYIDLMKYVSEYDNSLFNTFKI